MEKKLSFFSTTMSYDAGRKFHFFFFFFFCRILKFFDIYQCGVAQWFTCLSYSFALCVVLNLSIIFRCIKRAVTVSFKQLIGYYIIFVTSIFYEDVLSC